MGVHGRALRCYRRRHRDQHWRAPSMRWRSGAWRFDDVVPRTHDASGFDSDEDEGDADRATGSAASLTKRDQYGVDWDDIDSAQRPAMEAARLMHTARQMVDTSRWWLMRWPRNATPLLVRAGGLRGWGTARREVRRCRTGSRLPICPHIRSDVLCIVGPLRCRGRSCRIDSEQLTAYTWRQARGCRLCRNHFRPRRRPTRQRRQD